MEQPQENLPISTSSKENSLSTEKSKVNLRPGAGKRLPWEQLKVEYLTGNIADVAEWGRVKGIATGTLEKQTVGWHDEYIERQGEIARKALGRLGKRQVTSVASRLRAGRILVAKGVKALTDEKIEKAEARDLAAIIKIGSDIQASVQDQSIHDAIEKLQNQVVGTTVTVSQGKGENEVRTEIKILARNLAGSRIDRLGRKSAILGTGEHPDGEQQAI